MLSATTANPEHETDHLYYFSDYTLIEDNEDNARYDVHDERTV